MDEAQKTVDDAKAEGRDEAQAQASGRRGRRRWTLVGGALAVGAVLLEPELIPGMALGLAVAAAPKVAPRVMARVRPWTEAARRAAEGVVARGRQISDEIGKRTKEGLAHVNQRIASRRQQQHA
jgi:hypothetical protein